MKKILKCGLFALMVSGFMNANAAKMGETVASSSSRQSAAVESVKDFLSQSLLTVVEEYDALKSSGAHTGARPDATTAAEKVEYPALYDLIMKAKDCPVKGFIREISPMFQQTLQQIRPRGEEQLCAWKGLRERSYSEWERLFDSLKYLVYAVICLYNGQLTGCYFKTIEDYSEYLDIISILKSKGKTLPGTFLKPNEQLHAAFFLGAEAPESEEDYNERVCALNKLLEAKLISSVDFYVDDRLSEALSANLSSQGDTDLFGVVFRGREGGLHLHQ